MVKTIRLPYNNTKMAFILGVGKKTADQPQGRFAEKFGFFIQP